MNTRRHFIKTTVGFAIGASILPSLASCSKRATSVGVQLYSVRAEMLADAQGTLKKIAAMGYTQLESAGSEKGNYYGLKPAEVKQICKDLGVTMRSGHIHLDDTFEQSMDQAKEIGQEYLIVSVMPTNGQTMDNYKAGAAAFNKAGEACVKNGLKFGYHNHNYEFDEDNGKVLYDVLVEETDPKLVHLEMDLGWVINAGKNPLDYFKKYPGRFPLWHLKDMDMKAGHSIEFGKGGLDIASMFAHADEAGMVQYFIEQEEYTHSAFESLQADIDYLKQMDL